MNHIESIIESFFKAYWRPGMKTVFVDRIPVEMLAGPVDNEGWVEWRVTKGKLRAEDYQQIEKEFDVKFPESFIAWHRSHFFLDCDCSIIRLPVSSPTAPLKEIRENLEWNRNLLEQGLIPFGYEGNDTGPLVFETRYALVSSDYPIKVYDQSLDDLEGLSEIVFSSFSKLLECVTHFLNMRGRKKDFEIIPDFYLIDSEGAGSKGGRVYWNSWTGMLRANDKLGGPY